MLRQLTVSFASLSLVLLALGVAAAENQPQKTEVSRVAKSRVAIDLRLGDQAEVTGRILDRQGKAQAGVAISMVQARGNKVSTRTDKDGKFRLVGLSSGTAQLHALNQSASCRLWTAKLAPPNAKAELLITTGVATRGQAAACAGPNCAGCATCANGATGAPYMGHFGGMFQRMLQNPWLIGAGTAAAIAIPLALDDDDEPSS